MYDKPVESRIRYYINKLHPCTFTKAIPCVLRDNSSEASYSEQYKMRNDHYSEQYKRRNDHFFRGSSFDEGYMYLPCSNQSGQYMSNTFEAPR